MSAIILCIALVSLSASLETDSSVSAVSRPNVGWGSTGEHVRAVQSRLSQWGYFHGTIDGVYGGETYRAVTAFQSRNGLWPVDGIVGQSTWAALGLPSTSPASTPTAATGIGAVDRGDHLELLARVIAAEAQGEPLEGQVAVGAVILNRVNDPGFPNTLSGVIYQPHAFESVTNGLVWSRTPSDTAYSAARHALNGWDPTYGAIFFWNPSKPVSPWIWSRQIIVRIGSHVFAI